MSAPVIVSVCRSCGWRGFPERIWCPACGGDELDSREEERGVVEDATTVHRAAGRTLAAPIRLGTVRSDGGARIVVRLDGEPGDRVRLRVEDGAPAAHGYDDGR